MKRFVVVVGVMAAVIVAVLACMAYWFCNELDTLKRKVMTAPARAARWAKKEEAQAQEEQEKQDNNTVTETQNEKA